MVKAAACLPEQQDKGKPWAGTSQSSTSSEREKVAETRVKLLLPQPGAAARDVLQDTALAPGVGQILAPWGSPGSWLGSAPHKARLCLGTIALVLPALWSLPANMNWLHVTQLK